MNYLSWHLIEKKGTVQPCGLVYDTSLGVVTIPMRSAEAHIVAGKTAKRTDFPFNLKYSYVICLYFETNNTL